MSKENFTRRNFLQISAMSGLALSVMNKRIHAEVFSQNTELEEITISQLQAKMKSGALSAQSLTEKYLERIKAIDPKLNSVIEINPDALKIAESTLR